MNEISVKENKRIENLIYEVRNKYVMLDSDLAKLYECKNGTKSINLAVNRNKDRFPEDFYFQLSKEEYVNLKFQNETSNNYGGVRKIPYVFTEQGVAMLSSILKTEVASKVSVNIMRAFVEMRKYISTDLLEQRYINNMVLKHDNEIKLLQDTFEKFKSDNNNIFFEGQIYDAYSLLLDIFESSKENIIIIDNYADKNLLDLLSKTKKKVKVYSKNVDNELIKKYKTQYYNLEIFKNNTFHDRFIIIDNKELYHCGASFKELRKKCFAINKIDNIDWINKLNEYINDNKH